MLRSEQVLCGVQNEVLHTGVGVDVRSETQRETRGEVMNEEPVVSESRVLRVGHAVTVEFEDGVVLRVLGDVARWEEPSTDD